MVAPGRFGTTWWGRAWLEALESAGSGYESRFPRGRTFARKGAVRELQINPGHVAAEVTGTRGDTYRVDLGVRCLLESEWEQVAASIAGKAAHMAALLEGELDPGVVADASSAEIELIPGASDLRPDCTCPDWAEPCKHAAAVCYMVAEEFDRNPFALFLLRGINRDDLIELVRSRRGDQVSERRAEGDGQPDHIDAADLWAGHTIDEDLSPVPSLLRHRSIDPRQPGRRVPWDASPPARFGIDPSAIDELADDAVDRAWRMLVDDHRSGLTAAAVADLARRTVARPPRLNEFASLAGVTPGRLRSWADAWWTGGDIAVLMVADPDYWQADQKALAEGRDVLVQLGHPRRSISLNYDSLRMSGSVWLAIGPDDRWYRMQGPGKHQDLRMSAAPSLDLRDLVDAVD